MTGKEKKKGKKILFILLPDSVSHSNLPRFISLLLGISLRELISGQKKVCREIDYKLFIVTENKRAYRIQKLSKMTYLQKRTPSPSKKTKRTKKSHQTSLPQKLREKVSLIQEERLPK